MLFQYFFPSIVYFVILYKLNTLFFVHIFIYASSASKMTNIRETGFTDRALQTELTKSLH